MKKFVGATPIDIKLSSDLSDIVNLSSFIHSQLVCHTPYHDTRLTTSPLS